MVTPALAILPVLLGAAPQDTPVEVAPPPRLVAPAVAFEPIPSGYRVLLNRNTAERLQELLDQADEKELAATLKKLAKEKDDPETAAKLNLAAFLVASQVPGFKKALHDNLGPGGVVITVTGLQKPEVRTGRKRVDRAFRVLRNVAPLLPDDARETIQGIDAMARTTPLIWKVEPRK